jgi:hypothetical protein
MNNSHALYNSTLNASTASVGIGTVSHIDLLTYLHTRTDGAYVRGRSTRPLVDPRPGPVHLACARAASTSTFKFTQARSADSARRPTLYFNAIFLPCPPARSRPAAAHTVACQLPRQRLTVPAPTVTCPALFLLHLSAGQTRPGVQVPPVNLLSPAPGQPARHLVEAANPATVTICSSPRLSECHSPLNV